MKKVRKGTVLGDAAVKATDGLSPLKTVLGAISAVYADSKVRLRPPVQNPSLTNPSAGNCRRRKQDRRPSLTYSRVGSPFHNTSWWRVRAEAPARTNTVCHVSLLRLRSEFLPASSRSPRDNCGCYMGGHYGSDLPTTFKTMKMCSGFSRTYKRPSPATRFVDDLGTHIDADRDSRRCSKQRSTNMVVD